jgi:hypothetical protein
VTTVFEHFDIRYACWRSEGGCRSYHGDHIHISTGPDFDNATPRCAGGTAGFASPTENVLALREEMMKRFPRIRDLGISNCRFVAGTTTWSGHAYNMAWDAGIPIVGGEYEMAYGDEMYAWLNGEWEEDPFMGRFSDEELNNLDNLLAGAQKVKDGRELEAGDGFWRRVGYTAALLAQHASHLNNFCDGLDTNAPGGPKYKQAGQKAMEAAGP